jgi:predicted nucleotidyltransferase
VAADKGSLEKRRLKAVAGARAATEALAVLGVQTLVTGSLARGSFGPHSDVDLLVTECPRHLKYAIEGIVEDKLAGMPFDLVYLDEVPQWKLASFTGATVHASQLR